MRITFQPFNSFIVFGLLIRSLLSAFPFAYYRSSCWLKIDLDCRRLTTCTLCALINMYHSHKCANNAPFSNSYLLTGVKLVVVGDQSSGKSSVLEGLTNLPFPRDSGLCTRHPTQIVYKRSPETQVAVSIIPAKNSIKEH